jgi:hypothetical protein
LRRLLLICVVLGLLLIGSSFVLIWGWNIYPADRKLDVNPRRYRDIPSQDSFTYAGIEINTGGDQGCPVFGRCLKPGLMLVVHHKHVEYHFNFVNCADAYKGPYDDDEFASSWQDAVCDGKKFTLMNSAGSFKIFREGVRFLEVSKSDFR